MSPPEKIPKAMAAKFAAITALTDAFCAEHLNDEYRILIRRVVGALARKHSSPLVKGEEIVWAAAAVHAAGHVNFLDDPSQVPHCKSKRLYELFSIGESTGQNKSKQIRQALGMERLSAKWTLPSRLADNPTIWLLKVNGFVMDIRNAPVDVQQLAYEKGLIPFVPGEHNSTKE
jgi:hypothetical protein